jgi:hypothetical protein
MVHDDKLKTTAGEYWELADLRLMSGQQMNLFNSQSKLQHRVQFIGALRGHSLITTLPKELSDLWVKPSDQYVLRGLANTHAYAISCHPISVNDKPYPHIHFAYPELALVRKARNASRITLKMPLEIMRGNKAADMGMLTDISITGAGITSAVSLGAPGEEIEVGIPIILDAHTQQIVVAALIVWTKPDAKSGFRHGLTFPALPHSEDLLLRAFIGHHLSIQCGST